jgi:hypothetical protein
MQGHAAGCPHAGWGSALLPPPPRPRAAGPEIWRQTGGRVTHLVCTCGTYGTIMGTGRYLKEQNPDVQVVGVQPAADDAAAADLYASLGPASAVAGSGAPSAIPGIRRWPPGYMPRLYKPEGLDQVIDVTAREAEESARALARAEGVLSGISGGGALSAALRLGAEVDDAVVVIVVPDKVGRRALRASGAGCAASAARQRLRGGRPWQMLPKQQPQPTCTPLSLTLCPRRRPHPQGDRYLSTGVFNAEAGADDPAPCPAPELPSALARLLYSTPGPHYVLLRAGAAGGGRPEGVAAAAAARAAAAAGGGRLLEVVAADALQQQQMRHTLRCGAELVGCGQERGRVGERERR